MNMLLNLKMPFEPYMNSPRLWQDELALFYRGKPWKDMMMLYSYMVKICKTQLTLLQESVRLPFEQPKGKCEDHSGTE